MYDLPGQSLSVSLINPSQMRTDFSHVPLSSLKTAMISAKKTTLNTELALLRFYFYNHAFSLIQGQFGVTQSLPLDLQGITKRHHHHTNDIAKRMFFQTIAATHGHLCIGSGNNMATFWTSMGGRFGKNIAEFFKKNPNSYNFQQWTSMFPEDATCGEFLRSTLAVFTSNGQGWARAWANIARLGSDFITGHMSLENTADQAFSICHNGGSILNKGHFFTVCSHTMYHLLDIQDSGQIPQYLLGEKGTDKELLADATLLADYFPELKAPLNTSKISNSAKKRDQYTKNLAKVAWAAPGGMGAPQPPQPTVDQKINTILLGDKIKTARM